MIFQCLFDVFLWTGTVSPFSHRGGKTPALTHCLKIISSSLKIPGQQIFNMRMLILS